MSASERVHTSFPMKSDLQNTLRIIVFDLNSQTETMALAYILRAFIVMFACFLPHTATVSTPF